MGQARGLLLKAALKRREAKQQNLNNNSSDKETGIMCTQTLIAVHT